jgi:hypothetical protein
MMRIPQQTLIQITLLVGVGVLIWGGSLLAPKDVQEQSIKTEPESYWEGKIEELGSNKAYQEFAEAVKDRPVTRQHEAAHAFGGALYDIEKLQGISTCDARFSFGCYHEFMGRAIADNGLGIIPELNDICAQSNRTNQLACQHGIGHGIVSSIGYDEENLPLELSICRDLPYNDTIGGCYGGVFMEYNVRTMLGGTDIRQVENGNMFAPCDSLESEYLPACMFWQPQWWNQTLSNGSDDPDAFRRMGESCVGMSTDRRLQNSCFQGIGNITPPSANFSPERTRALCETMPDEDAVLQCKNTAANSLAASASDRRGAEMVCKGLVEDALKTCLKYAHLQAESINTNE